MEHISKWNNVNLGHLAIFNAVAAEGSVSRGAERLLISQPAASKQLKLLQKSLKTTLFERSPRGMRLTAAGEILADYARRIFTLDAEATIVMDELRRFRRGRLRISASPTIGVYLLPELFVKFRQMFPSIDASLEVAPSSGVEQRLVEGSIDLGFIESPPTDDKVEATQVMQDELVAIVTPNHPLRRKKRVTADKFCAEPFIVRATGSDTRSYVERELAARTLSIKPVMSLGSSEAIKRAVAAGIGVAIVSRLSIGLELKARTLAMIKVSGLAIRRPLYRVVRRGAAISPATDAFIDMMTRALTERQ
jgi:DNA-binding transcriptional LysR family regulator